MSYVEEEQNGVPLVGVILLVLGISGGGIYYLLFGAKEAPVTNTPPPQAESETTAPGESTALIPSEGIEESSAEILEKLGVKVKSAQPEDAAAQIAQILESGDLEKAATALGGVESGISAEALQRLQALAGANGFQLKQVREVGELEINRRKRFALEWENGEQPLFLDFTRAADGQWTVDKVRLPREEAASNPIEEPTPNTPSTPNQSTPASEADSLTVSDNFLQAALSQNFSKARPEAVFSASAGGAATSLGTSGLVMWRGTLGKIAGSATRKGELLGEGDQARDRATDSSLIALYTTSSGFILPDASKSG